MSAARLVRSTAVLAAATLVVRLVGLVREQLIAALYGTGPEADAFSVVAQLLVLALGVCGGAFAAVLVPATLRLREQGRLDDLRRLLGGAVGWAAVGAAAASLALYVFAGPLVAVYVPGFPPETQLLATRMLRVAAPGLAAVALAPLFAAILNAHGSFAVPGLGPALAGGGVIAAALAFAPGHGAVALVAGLAAGWGLYLAVAAVAARRRIRFRPTLRVTPELAAAARLASPLVLCAAVFQLNAVVDRTMASVAGGGVAAELGYASRVAALPLGVLLGPFVVPLFPAIAGTAAAGDAAALRRLLDRALRAVAIALLPVTAVLALFAGPLVEVLFERGEFGSAAARQTALALAAYAAMLVPFAARDVMTRVFFSLRDTRTPVWSNLLMVVTNVALMVALVPRFGIVAIAGSTSVSIAVSCLHLWSRLSRALPAATPGAARRSWRAIGIHAACFAGLAWAGHEAALALWRRSGPGPGLWGEAAAVGCACAAAGLVYLVLTLRLDIPEIDRLRRRLGMPGPGRRPAPRSGVG